MGVDPFTEMLKLAKSSRDEGIKLSCYRECSKYLYVQKRATEVSGPNETAIKVDAQSSELKETMELLTVLIDTKVNERKG